MTKALFQFAFMIELFVGWIVFLNTYDFAVSMFLMILGVLFLIAGDLSEKYTQD